MFRRVARAAISATLLTVVGCGPSGDDTSSSPTPTSTPGEATPTLTAATATPEPTETPIPVDTPPTTPVATPPPAPDVLVAGATLPLTLELMVEAGNAVAAPLADQTLLVMRNGSIAQWSEVAQETVSLGSTAGLLHNAAWIDDDVTLVSTATGLYVRLEEELVWSPLNNALPSSTPVTLLTAPGPGGDDLWMLSSNALYLYRGGKLYSLELGALFEPGMRITFGAPVENQPSLWFATSKGIYSLQEKSGSFAARLEREGDAAALAVDGDGTLWARVGADLWSRSWSGKWRWLRLPEPVGSMAANPAVSGVWVLGEKSLWHLLEDDPRPADGPTPSGLLAVDAAGRVLVETSSGIERRSDGYPVVFYGVNEGGRLAGPVDLYVLPTDVAGVTGVEAMLDGVAQSVLASPWRLSLTPLGLEEGAHELSATVHYADVADVSATLSFLVVNDPPTWNEDVQPLAKARCVSCHGSGGIAHQMYTYDQWRAQIDDILLQVSSGAMPLTGDPLTDDQIYLLQSWQASNFPE